MRESTNRPLAGRRPGDQTTQPVTRPAPQIVRRISTEFGRRHVKGVAITRLLVAIWLVILASIFCASGHWWGALLFVAAALVGSLAYLMPRWAAALDAENARPAQ
jgi:fatty acid desaturase